MRWEETNGKSRWENLMTVVRNVFNKIQNNQTMREYIRISVLLHEANTITVLKEKVADSILIDCIKPRFGENCFETAFSEAFKLVNETIKSYDNFRIIFMSDGGAEVPFDAMKAINESAVRKSHRLSFNLIVQGNCEWGKQTMEDISKELNTPFEVAVDLNSLQNSFNSFVENLHIKN
jgi:hypothetical protein